jgi:hypothetical protein
MVSRAYIAGKTPKAHARREMRRAHFRNYKPGRLEPWQMNAQQRRNELDRLARLRRRTGADLGPESGWAEVIGNLLRVRHGQVTVEDVHAEVAWLGLPKLNAQLVEDAVGHIARAAWGRYQLYSPKLAGDKLRLTSAERHEAGIQKIEAIDESRTERRRRLDRERKAERRAAKAAPSKPTKKQLAEMLKISRPTLNAWIAAGKVNPDTGEVYVSCPQVHT